MNQNIKQTSATRAAAASDDEPSQITATGNTSGGGVIGWFKQMLSGPNDGGLKESVEEVLHERADAGEEIAPDQREMLLNILGFGDLEVDDVMVPRADIIAIDVEADLRQVVDVFRQAHHSRLPVYRETLDEVIGFVHIKDLLPSWDLEGPFSLAGVLRQPLFVPHSMPVTDLLIRMRTSHIHMAIVVDEYGGADGLVTIEDVVEEIVGEIEDEHDTETAPELTERADGVVEADARVKIDAFEARFKVDLLPDELDEDVDTLGGLVFALSGRVPKIGDVLQHTCGLDFEVVDADPRRIKRLRIHHNGNQPNA
jgi:magnesium and cobalt transporter